MAIEDEHYPDETGDSFHGFRMSRHMNNLAMQEFNDSIAAKSIEGYVPPEDYERLDKIKAMSEMFDDVLFWCWNIKGEGGTFKLRNFESAKNHFIVMTALIKPEVFEGMSYEQIGKKISVTKQRISKIAESFEKEFGIKFRRSHKEKNNHASAARKSWNKPDRIKTWAKK